MATSPEAERLSEAHRLAQARLGAQVVEAMRAAWPLLDPRDLDGTLDRWLRTSATIVGAQRVTSARLAANYLRTFKPLELGPTSTPAPLVLVETAPARAVSTSLIVTGPAAIKSATARGVQLARAVEISEARTAAAAMRHVLDGGRATITRSLAVDPDAAGWRRTTSGAACDFCSTLAGRGDVYSASTVRFRSHDGCACSAEPAYRT